MTDIALIDEITNSIIGGSIRVHRRWGPGLLESAYHGCLAHELVRIGHKVDVNKPIPLEWGEFRTDCAYRIDRVLKDGIRRVGQRSPRRGRSTSLSPEI